MILSLDQGSILIIVTFAGTSITSQTLLASD